LARREAWVIVVDSSVWIDHLNGRSTDAVAILHRLLADDRETIAVGDIVLYEVLSGLRSDRAVAEVRLLLGGLTPAPMLGFHLAHAAADNYRSLRARGVTVNTADTFIATYCLEARAQLLTSDRDFLPLRDHLGLQLVPTIG
jgi:predicted nucleic acid-binding protein